MDPSGKVVGLVAALTVASAGVAVAYWSSTVAGTGTAGTGSSSPLVIHQSWTVASLAPGGLLQALAGNSDNPNSSPVTVAVVSATVTGTNKAGCEASN